MTSSMTSLPPSPAAPRRLTGRKVALIFATFFGAIASADAFLIMSAVRTYTGAETSSAYKAGQLYNGDIALARAQDERGLSVEPRVERAADGTVVLTADARDRQARPLAARSIEASFLRPTDKRADRTGLPLVETGAPGRYQARVEGLAAGQWDLVLDVLEESERVHRRKARIVLR
jgi:nitrogen fixation protein FixH